VSPRSPRVLVYAGKFVPSYLTLELFLRSRRITFQPVSDMNLADFRYCASHAVFVFPSGQYFGEDVDDALGGAAGVARLKEAIRGGMNYLGICAGAYAATGRSFPPVDISLGLSPARHRWPGEMGAGAQFLSVRIVPELAAPAGLCDDPQPVWYQNGPVFSGVAGDLQPLATFAPTRTERAQTRDGFLFRKRLSGAPAIVQSHYGKGRVVLCSPHLELGDLGIRDYHALLRQWIAAHGLAEVDYDPLSTGTASYRQFMKELGGPWLQPVRQSSNWRVLSALINDLL